MAAATVSSWIPPTLPDCDDYSGAVLIDMRCYFADRPNATTATGSTSRGLPIQVTFHAARPPLLSHFCVHCPGLEHPFSAPKVVATDADLVLLRVPGVPTATASIRSWDYFLYRPRSGLLDLLPNPHPLSFCDSATALLSREDGSSYVVAALNICGPVYQSKHTVIRWDFDLRLYCSSNSEGWITKRMSVEDLVRDTLVPIPADMEYPMLYHETGKTVTVGGEQGTVAWVDLWRGIFLCDVLRERPVLQDIPLPVPARGNWNHLLTQGKPYYIRDVTISQRKDSIKYIEMEIRPPRNQTTLSYLEWARGNSNRTPDSYLELVTGNSNSSQIIYDGWKARTWSMPVPVGSLTDWQPDCEVDVKEISMGAGNQHHCNLLSKLSDSGIVPTLQEISVAYPIMSMDDDIVYLLPRTKPRSNEKLELLIAVDMRKKILQGVAELGVQKSFILTRTICTSEISRYLRKSTGTIELKQTENEAVEPTEKEEVKPTKLKPICEGRGQQPEVYEETCISACQPARCDLVNRGRKQIWLPRSLFN
ncbi:unnamed protein product [Urochloa decumbens]|uniref:DUF1618 domain-containing protein n=1 Tax=Urochloa decumbens TaxID=240449 RepID=A0ABC9HF66_9POAL